LETAFLVMAEQKVQWMCDSSTEMSSVCSSQTNKMIVATTGNSKDRGSTFGTTGAGATRCGVFGTEEGTARLRNSGTTEAKFAGLETYSMSPLG